MLSDEHARRIAADLATWLVEGRISREDAAFYAGVFGKSLTENPECQEDAVLLHRKYSRKSA